MALRRRRRSAPQREVEGDLAQRSRVRDARAAARGEGGRLGGRLEGLVHGEGDACGAHALCEHLRWQRAEDERETRPPSPRLELAAVRRLEEDAAAQQPQRRNDAPLVGRVADEEEEGRRPAHRAERRAERTRRHRHRLTYHRRRAGGGRLRRSNVDDRRAAAGAISVGAIVVGGVGDGEGKESLCRRQPQRPVTHELRLLSPTLARRPRARRSVD